MISEFPLFVFTTFAGAAAGAYAIALFFPAKRSESEKAWLFPLVMLALLAVGLIGCLMHLQHPERFMNALFNPVAGIALEAYFSIVLGAVLVVDVAFCVVRGRALKAVRVIGAVAALALMFVMGYAYSISYGVQAWASPLSVLLFLVGDIALGAGICGAWTGGEWMPKGLRVTSVVASAAFALVVAGEAMCFAGLGLGMASLAVACVAAVAASVLAYAAKKPGVVAMGQCVVVLLSVCVARYAFYAACAF